jgi:hypothetical protein
MASDFTVAAGAVEINEEGRKGFPPMHVRSAWLRGSRPVFFMDEQHLSAQDLVVSVICLLIYTSGFKRNWGKCCAMLRPFYKKMDRENSAASSTQKGQNWR